MIAPVEFDADIVILPSMAGVKMSRNAERRPLGRREPEMSLRLQYREGLSEGGLNRADHMGRRAIEEDLRADITLSEIGKN